MSFFIWNIEGVGSPYPWDRVGEVHRSRRVEPHEEQRQEPGAGGPSARGPWQRALKEQEPPPTRRAVLSVGELMRSPVKTGRQSWTVKDAWAFLGAERVRHLPVVNKAGVLVGMVSERDLLRIAGTPDQLAEPGFLELTLGEIMAREVFTAGPDARVRDAARLMFQEAVGALPVVDDGELVGILTRSDILRALLREAPLDLWT
jgi:acetoin utilization protein AcuB